LGGLAAQKAQNREYRALTFISMKKARDFENAESIGIPINHLVSILRDSKRSKDVVEALHRGGFSTDEIGVLSGDEGVAKFDSAYGRRGLLAKLATSGVDMGDRDTDYIKEFRDAILNGQTVIIVMATCH
jgi:hypothetical protein